MPGLRKKITKTAFAVDYSAQGDILGTFIVQGKGLFMAADANKKLTFQELVEANGPGYNPGDIRTYTCLPLAGGPAMEIAIHLSLESEHKSGKGTFAGRHQSTPYGGHFTNYSVETQRKVSNMIIHFPKASEFPSLKLLKSLDLPTLYPSWMIERYGKEASDNLMLRHSTPIFYDLSSNKFVLFLDTEFFQGTTPEGLKFPVTANTKIYTGKDKRAYAAFQADTLKGLVELMEGRAEATPFQDYLQIYRQRFLDASKGERVICLAMKTTSTSPEHGPAGVDKRAVALHSSSASRSTRETIQKLVLAHNTHFELYQGALIGDLIYLMDEQGALYPDAIMCSTKHQRLRKEVITIYKHDDYTFLMMPYDEEDWLTLKRLNERMLDLMNEINTFFKSGYNKEGLYDASVKQLTQLSGPARLLLDSK